MLLRRQFLKRLLDSTAKAVGAGFLLTSCGKLISQFDDQKTLLLKSHDSISVGPGALPSSLPAPSPVPGACDIYGARVNSISSNHGHAYVTVPVGDVLAGVQMSYSIQDGTTDSHGHFFTLTAANFATLQSSGTVSVVSTSTNGHTHDLTVGCVTALL